MSPTGNLAPARRNGRRWAAVAVMIALVAASIVAVQTASCGWGVHTSEAALRDLITASTDATDTHDVCRYVTRGYEYSMSDVRVITTTFGTVDPDDLTITTTDQLGTLVFLTASTPDGTDSMDFTATDDEGKRATINLGTYPDTQDQ